MRIIEDLSIESEGKHAMLDSLLSLLSVYQIKSSGFDIPGFRHGCCVSLSNHVASKCMYVVVVSGMDFPDMTGK